MYNKILEYLNTSEFDISVGFILPTKPLRKRLRSMLVVRRLRAAIRRGELQEQACRDFVSTLLSEFRKGKRLPGDLALAAIAVAVEGMQIRFADDLLEKLAKLEVAEIPIATRIARECLKSHHQIPVNETRINLYKNQIGDLHQLMGKTAANKAKLKKLISALRRQKIVATTVFWTVGMKHNCSGVCLVPSARSTKPRATAPRMGRSYLRSRNGIPRDIRRLVMKEFI